MASLRQNAVKFNAKLPEVTKETSMLQGKTALITNATSVAYRTRIISSL